MLYFQIKFSSVFSPQFCLFSSPNWTGLGQDHYSKWEASHNRATKECHYPAIFLGQKWFSGSYLYRDSHLRRTKPGQQQEGRQCACCAVSCLLTKPGRLISTDAPTASRADPSIQHMMLWFDPTKQSSKKKSPTHSRQWVSLWGQSSGSHAMFVCLLVTNFSNLPTILSSNIMAHTQSIVFITFIWWDAAYSVRDRRYTRNWAESLERKQNTK